MENKEKVPANVDPERPKKKGWDSNSCPLFIFGDDDAAEYDMKKLKQFFAQFKKKSE